MSTHGFYSKDNLKLLLNIFKDYMSDKHNINIDSIDTEANLRKILFDIISGVNEECSKHKQQLPIQTLNIRVLNIARDYYFKKYPELKDKSEKKPNIQNLSRDKSIFGDRQVNTSILMPESDPYTRRNAAETPSKEVILERLVLERDREVGLEQRRPAKELQDKVMNSSIIEKAETADDFLRKLKSLESERNIILEDIESKRGSTPPPSSQNDIFIQSSSSMMNERIHTDRETKNINSIAQQDPKQIMARIHETQVQPTQPTHQLQTSHKNIAPLFNTTIGNSIQECDQASFSEGKELTVIPRNLKNKIVEKYISINSFDRNWSIEQQRYRYSINFLAKPNDIQNRYRNIDSISVGKVIIPDEIVQTADPIKSSFNNEFTFSHQYMILRIEEFKDVYDGTNDSVRQAFCKLIFDKAYKGQNGRGFVVLKPIQHEKKMFYPAPLSSLNKLSISLLKPNGALFNNSMDNFNILKLEYDVTKPNYLKLTTDIFFDKNDFYIGDYVLLKNYVMTKLSAFQQDIDINFFNDYINRSDGFEIMQVGTANGNGFYNVFYIMAPGTFDKTIGQYLVNTNIITCLNNYNSQIITPTNNGNVMNFSLQHSISMKLNLIVDDASIIDSQKNFYT